MLAGVMQPQPTNSPHPLDLYRLAVQHPLAEVAFVEHVWAQLNGPTSEPMLLREDFAGTCAVSAAWCASDPDRQAMAIELDEATAHWAADRFDDADLHIVVADVMTVDEPMVDVTLSLNFSTFVFHDYRRLLGYLQNARASLNPGGLLIMDLFGGASVAVPSMQARRVEPDEGGFEPFDYAWEQRGLDPASGRIECRIHFELGDGRRLTEAFVYDWRLWGADELIAAAHEAGFAEAALWWAPSGGGGRFEPVKAEPEEAAWVAYVVCQAPGSAA